jgi:hypothetical protein
MNPVDQFVLVAPDCPTEVAVAPVAKGERPSLAFLEYSLLTASPYTYSLEDLQFAVHLRHKAIPPDRLEADGAALREAFLARPRACLRACALTQRYGFGAHYDHNGKIALYPRESARYQELAEDAAIEKVHALRLRKAASP